MLFHHQSHGQTQNVGFAIGRECVGNATVNLKGVTVHITHCGQPYIADSGLHESISRIPWHSPIPLAHSDKRTRHFLMNVNSLIALS